MISTQPPGMTIYKSAPRDQYFTEAVPPYKVVSSGYGETPCKSYSCILLPGNGRQSDVVFTCELEGQSKVGPV